MTEYSPVNSPISPTSPISLSYTFGNHMHWVDMEWLWGYFVLPSSVRDMLRFCAETGAKGNVNFDGIGYEKLAVEAPDALAELREAVQRGQIEVVGASYGQPYGLFHGGESNVRQRVYGARTVRRLLGVWPRAFWEEEFDFFPQLPQMLTGAGFAYASLFFQWTWHTPEVPKETMPAVWWEGQDGSRLLAGTRNALNLHQWPEDFDGLLDSPLLREMPAAGIVQWLELMPSPDWMCRSEVLLPRMKELLADPRFEIRPATLPEYLEAARPHAEPRRYTLDDVWHGMSLGKNGDQMRRHSRRAEAQVLAAESASTVAAFFGRPYPGWNVYPTWELEESWRELLSAQHHDNDECEGLNGHIGLRSYERSDGLSKHVLRRTVGLLAERAPGSPRRMLVFNPLGWSRDGLMTPNDQTPDQGIARAIPPFGFVVVERDKIERPAAVAVEETDREITLRRGSLALTVDRERGVVQQFVAPDFPDGALLPETPLGLVEMVHKGQVERFAEAAVSIHNTAWNPVLVVHRKGADDRSIFLSIGLAPDADAIDIHYQAGNLPRPDGRMHAALQTAIAVNLPNYRLIHDHPYGLSEVKADGTYLRKYPTGDWMTSPQVFEEIRNPFTALSLLDFDGGDRGLLYLHDGSQQFFRDGNVVRNVLTMYDPWDEDYFVDSLDARVRLVPHGPITNAERWRLAQEFTRPVITATTDKPGGDLPPTFGAVWCDAPNVAVTALFRETTESGQHLDRYAGDGIEFPTILRLVELDGQATTARLILPGPIAAARTASTRGDRLADLAVSPTTAPAGMPWPEVWSAVAVDLRPYEIATLYLDLVGARKVTRDLDAARHVWATVHRIEGTHGRGITSTPRPSPFHRRADPPARPHTREP